MRGGNCLRKHAPVHPVLLSQSQLASSEDTFGSFLDVSFSEHSKPETSLDVALSLLHLLNCCLDLG